MLCGVCRALGLHAESAVLPGEDKDKFQQLLERLSAAWMPQDNREKSLVEQIAVNQWNWSASNGPFPAPSPIWTTTARPAFNATRKSGLQKRKTTKGALSGAPHNRTAFISCSRR